MKLRSVIGAGIIVATGVAFSAAPVSAGSHSGLARHGKLAAAKLHDPEFSPLSVLASRIQQLGESQYASAFAGVQLADRARILDVYVVLPDDSRFLHAVAAADTMHLPYTVKVVTRNYATQTATGVWIATHRAALQREGVVPQWWGPHSSYDAVLVALKAPSSQQIIDLRAAVRNLEKSHTSKRSLHMPSGMLVTVGTYTTVAAAVMNAEAPTPADIVAYPALMGPSQPSDGYTDQKPLKGADQIEYTLSNTATCTSNFSVNDANNPNQDYMITAGHCSGDATGHDWYTCATYNGSGNCNYNIGTVSRLYSYYDDYELTPTSDEGYVWNDSDGSKWSINGYIDPAQGNYLTANGQTDGAKYDLYVEQSGGQGSCTTYGSYTVCHAVVLQTQSGPICKGGDSGGTILQRESDGYHIYAAGIILGKSYDVFGNYYCEGQEISWIRNEANVRIMWGN